MATSAANIVESIGGTFLFENIVNRRIPKGPFLFTCPRWSLTPVKVTHTRDFKKPMQLLLFSCDVHILDAGSLVIGVVEWPQKTHFHLLHAGFYPLLGVRFIKSLHLRPLRGCSPLRPVVSCFSKRRRRAWGCEPLRVRAGGPFYLPISDGVRLTSSRGMMRMPNAPGRFSCPHSGSVSNGLLHPSSSRG